MTVKVLAFGVAKEIFEKDFAEISIEDDSVTSARLKELLEEKYPRLRWLSSFMLAVNNKYAIGGEIIKESDEIAVIPPVSGG